MPQPFVGEIRMFGGDFAPADWAFCDGSVLPIQEYSTLFNLIETTYGGDGVETFCLPDLRGRFPVHQGTFDDDSAVIGQHGGAETVTLTEDQLPSHTHTVKAVKAGATSSPVGAIWAGAPTPAYSSAASNVLMSSTAITSVGSSQPHENMSPYLGISFIIALFGIYPSPD